MTSSPRPAGLSGDAGLTPEPRALDQQPPSMSEICHDLIVQRDEAVERVGQLEALVHEAIDVIDGEGMTTTAADLRAKFDALAAVETLEKGTPDA